MKNLFNLIRKYEKKTERFIIKEIWLILYILLYLVHFVAFFAKYSHFRFTKNLIVGFSISKAEFKSIDVVIDFSGWFLWKILTIFQRYMTINNVSQIFFFSNSLSIELNNIALMDIYLLFWCKLRYFR